MLPCVSSGECTIGGIVSLQTPGPTLAAESQSWPIKEGAKGKSLTLRYIKEEQCWERLPESDVSYAPPDQSGQV